MGEPFLFLDEAFLSETGARGTYMITGREDALRGHFKGNPVMPASLLLEALGQLGVFFLLHAPSMVEALGVVGATVDPRSILLMSCDGVRCSRVCRPGDRLELSIAPRRIRAPLAVLTGKIRVGEQRAVLAEEIALSFGVKPVT